MDRKKELLNAYKQRKVVGGVYRIVNDANARYLLVATPDLAGARNRHNFSVATENCIFGMMAEDWKATGAKHFQFEVLEELEKKDEQSDADFAGELALLEEMWRDKLDPALAY